MAKAFKCDVCSKLIEGKPETSGPIVYKNNIVEGDRMEFCTDCHRDLKHFLNISTEKNEQYK